MGAFSTSAATMSDHDPIADLELLLAPIKADDPVDLARIRNARRAAAQRLADAAKLIRVRR